MEGRVVLVGVSGIVGVGKSTALRLLSESNLLQESLSENERVVFVPEPSDLWRQKGWLSSYYSDQNKYALPFQMLVYMTHVNAVQDAIRAAQSNNQEKTIVVVVERTMYDQMLFWKLQTDLEFESATRMHDEAYMMAWEKWNAFLPPVSLILFLNTSSIQKAMHRVQNRGRREELTSSSSSSDTDDVIEDVNGFTLSYQTRLEQKHKEWYTAPRAFPVGLAGTEGVPCAHISADRPYHRSLEALQTLASDMAAAIKQVL